MGDGWPISWSDRCVWRDLPSPALIAPNEFIAKRIGQDIGHILRQAGVTIEVESKGAA